MGRASAAWVGALACVLVAKVASAQDEATPQTETSTVVEDGGETASAADRGRDLYEQGKYLEALEAFKEAHDAEPTAAMKYNIARSYEQLSQWSDAITWYEEYLEVETNPRDRSQVLDKIELLKKRVGDDTPEGRYEARMAAGRTAYSRGDYERAISEFQAAFEAKADAAALYNIAKSYERMARYEEAIDYFEQYLTLEPDAPDRADVEETIRALRKAIRERFQELTISSDPPGADIYLDDRNSEIVGQTNFSLKVTPGPHTLYLELNGYEPVEREFVMPDDKPLALDFKLQPISNAGELVVNVEQEGARIYVDGAIVGLSPFTQKKKLEQGPHQVQVELPGFNRYSEEVMITKDETTVLDVELEKYKPGISSGTLNDWGTTLMIVGIVGGTLGFLTPFIYQEFVLERDYFDPLGPEDIAGNRFYRGPDTEDGLRDNGEFQTLKTVQTVSLAVGSSLAAIGLGFHIWKWVRKKPPPPVTAGRPGNGENRPWVTLESLSIGPAGRDGAAVGVSGRF